MHEEAFYLAFEIGSLTIKRTTTGAVVTAPDFWCRVQARAPCFASTYTVYKQLRSKNWWVAVPAVPAVAVCVFTGGARTEQDCSQWRSCWV